MSSDGNDEGISFLRFLLTVFPTLVGAFHIVLFMLPSHSGHLGHRATPVLTETSRLPHPSPAFSGSPPGAFSQSSPEGLEGEVSERCVPVSDGLLPSCLHHFAFT